MRMRPVQELTTNLTERTTHIIGGANNTHLLGDWDLDYSLLGLHLRLQNCNNTGLLQRARVWEKATTPTTS